MAYITLALDTNSHRLMVKGQRLAETHAAIWLREGSYPPVLYVPRADVDAALLQKTDRVTHCPHKGQCSYYSVITPEGVVENALWSYEDPLPQVAEIAGHFGFYAGKVDLDPDHG